MDRLAVINGSRKLKGYERCTEIWFHFRITRIKDASRRRIEVKNWKMIAAVTIPIVLFRISLFNRLLSYAVSETASRKELRESLLCNRYMFV